jgi:bla regulator protein blaR1
MSPFDLLGNLGRASVVGACAAVVAGLALAWLQPRIPATLRAWVWWLVAAQFVVAIVPTVRWVIPVVRSESEFQSFTPPARIASDQASAFATRIVEGPAASPGIPLAPIAWAGLALWALGVGALGFRHLRAKRKLERAWRAADAYAPSPAEARLLKAQRASDGITPEICVTTEFKVPLTLSGRRPRILLPADFLELTEESRLLILAHECAHVTRRDLWFGWLPALVEICFWFHPLARWVVREYGQAREEACDARALRAVPSSTRSYGELLMHVGVVPRSIPSTASCGSPTHKALLRRLTMLDHSLVVSRFGRVAGVGLIAVAALSLIPLRIEAGDSHHAKSGSEFKEVQWVPTSKPKPLSVPPHLEIERFAYLLVEADGKRSNGAMNTNDGDLARRGQKHLGGQVWWFRLDRRGYVVNDPEVMREVRSLYADQDERWSSQLGPLDERLELVNAQIERLNQQVEHFDDKRLHLEDSRLAIEEKQADTGRTDRTVDPKLEKIQASLAELDVALDDLHQTQKDLYRDSNELHRERESVYREVEEQDLEFKQRLYEIAKDAVERGVAQAY